MEARGTGRPRRGGSVSRPRARGCALALAAALALGSCGDDPGAAQPPAPSQPSTTGATPSTTSSSPSPSPSASVPVTERAILLRFDEVVAGRPAPETFHNQGTSSVVVRPVTWGSGRVLGVRSPHGRGVRLPEFAARNPGFAILRAVNSGDGNALSPGEHEFKFGADMLIDRVTTGSSADDGDNLIQRGLFKGTSQYKIQVDDGRVSCRVRGLGGEVIVAAAERVEPGTWYRLRCHRRGDTLTLQSARIVKGEPLVWATATRTGSIGPVVMPSDVPLSVGGKLSADGVLLPSSTDQFNGSLDRVFFRVIPD